MLERILEALACDLRERGGLDLSECFIDARSSSRVAGVWVRGMRGKGTKLLAGDKLADRAGLLLAVCAAAATPHESRLVAHTLDSRFVDALPQRLIGDRADNADPLDRELAALGVEMIAPHRRNRKKPKTQDGWPLRRYQRRWTMERLFAWLGAFRRLVARSECHARNFLGFVHRCCNLILLRQG
jgi:transposase